MEDDADLFLIEISISHFSMGTQELVCLNKIVLFLLSQRIPQKTLHIIFKHYLEQIPCN